MLVSNFKDLWRLFKIKNIVPTECFGLQEYVTLVLSRIDVVVDCHHHRPLKNSLHIGGFTLSIKGIGMYSNDPVTMPDEWLYRQII